MLEGGEAPVRLKLIDDVADTDRPKEHGLAFGAADRLSWRAAWPQVVVCHCNLSFWRFNASTAATSAVVLIHQRGEANRLRGALSARRRVSSSASARVQIERPRLEMSFIRNSPVDDNTGNPPADASPTPGVVHMKLTVPAKKMTASRPPAMDALGNHGLAATNAAVISSIIPSTLPNVSMDMMW